MVAAVGLGVAREQGRRGGFYSRAQVEAVRDGLVTPRHGMGAVWPGYGGDVQRPAGQWWRSGGAAWLARTHHVARRRTHRHRAQGPRSAAHEPLDAGRPRRACRATYDGRPS
jgi:hypothetical protein